MKLVISVVDDRDKDRVTDALLRTGYKFTCLGSTGGLLKEGNMTLLLAAEDAEVERVLQLIGSSSRTREQFLNVMPPDAASVGTALSAPTKVQVGGAVCFVVNIEQVHHF